MKQTLYKNCFLIALISAIFTALITTILTIGGVYIINKSTDGNGNLTGILLIVLGWIIIVPPIIMSICWWNIIRNNKYVLKTNILPLLSVFLCGIFGIVIAWFCFTYKGENELYKNKEDSNTISRHSTISDEEKQQLIKKFEKMFKEGIISKEEFDTKKNYILRKREKF